MKKYIAFLLVIACMLIALPITSHSGVFADPNAFEPDCNDESGLSPLYNATVTNVKFLGTDGTSEYFLLKLTGGNVHILEGERKSHLRVFAKACDECTLPNGDPLSIGTLDGGSQLLNGEVFSINVNSANKAADNFAEIGIKLPVEMIQAETTIMMEFNYCDGSAPWESNNNKLCKLFVDERSRCPIPELPPPADPNPFLRAETEIVIVPEMTITTGSTQFTTPDEDHVFMQINITGPMMHILDGGNLGQIAVWRAYGNSTSTNVSKQVELIDNGNNVFTLRITVLDQLKIQFQQTSYKIDYEDPPMPLFEYNVQKMCTLVTNKPTPSFCNQLQFVPIPVQMVQPKTPSDE